MWARVLSEGRYLFEPVLVVLLSLWGHALRAHVLQQRGGLHRPHQWAVWLSCGYHSVRQGSQPLLLQGGPGVRIGLSVGVVVRDGIGMRERHHVHNEPDEFVIINQHIFIVINHEHDHRYLPNLW